eukprot:m.293233 g.293233  ORF g.293233 m.293233 type:complete len:659 (-) comp19553_c0_seq1:66-2042(-)
MSAKRSASNDDFSQASLSDLFPTSTIFDALSQPYSQPSAKAAKVSQNLDRGQYAVDQVMQQGYATLPTSQSGIMAPSFVGNAEGQQQLAQLSQQEQQRMQLTQASLSSQTVSQAQSMLESSMPSDIPSSIADFLEFDTFQPGDLAASFADTTSQAMSMAHPVSDTLQSITSVAESAGPVVSQSMAHNGMQGASAPEEDALVQRVTNYISTPPSERGDMRLVLLHPRVVQKSYGSEKRFFCPPPAMVLRGKGWFQNVALGDVQMYVNMHMDPDKGEHQQVHLETFGEEARGTARSLYIPDSDKRKSFCLHIKTFFAKGEAGRDVGTFASKPLRVISKPSKKKQSTKTNPDMCMEDGCEIVLFNRMRTSAATTRYLRFTEEGFLSHSAEGWNSFRMKLVSDQAGHPVAHSIRRQRFVNYNNQVDLTCLQTNVTMRCIIVKLDKNITDPTSTDPVSQLQKIALARMEQPDQFATFKDNAVTFIKGKKAPDDRPAGTFKVPEAAFWTICTCARSEYCFSDPRIINGLPGDPVTPVPLVDMVKTLGKFVELYGEHFSTMLTVYFNNVPAETFYRCEELLFCTPPSYEKIDPQSNGVCNAPKEVELTLVRDDGVIYNTGKTYTYDVDHLMMLQLFANGNPGAPLPSATNPQAASSLMSGASGTL